MPDITVLANPAWHALTGAHAPLSEGRGAVRRYVPEISPFLGIERAQDVRGLAEIVLPQQACVVMADFEIAEPPPGFSISGRFDVLQMVASDVEAVPSPVPLHELGEADSPEMLALAELTKPGPFGPGTWRMGPFMGIRDGARLAAMTGHRFHLPGFTEVSGVCTYPDYLGRGYAQALVSHMTRRVLDAGKTAFLQARLENDRAIAVYRKLGYTDHAQLHVTVLANVLP